MKLACAASPAELINGAENLTKYTNEDGIVDSFLSVCVYIYFFFYLDSVLILKQ